MTDTPPWSGQAPRYPQPAQPGYWQQPANDQPGYGAPGYPPPGYGQRGGWAVSAPAPGSVPLRPLGVGDILSGAFSLIRCNPAATLGLTASIVTVLAIASGVIFLIAAQTAGAVALLVVPVAATFLAFQLGGLAAAMGRGLLGRKLTIAEAVRHSRAGWVILAVLVLAGLFLAFWLPLTIALKGWGALLALGLTAWLAVMFSLTIPVVVLEKRGPFAALGRSWRLVLGSYWRVFGIYLLMYLITVAINFVVSLPLEIAGGLAGGLGLGSARATVSVTVAVFAIGEIVIASLTATIETGVLVLVYADMRMRKEGMDLVLQQAAQSRQLTGEEFATSGLTSAYTGGADPGADFQGGGSAGSFPAGPPVT